MLTVLTIAQLHFQNKSSPPPSERRWLVMAYRCMPTRRSVRKVSLTRSVVGTTIDANDCPTEGVKDGT